MEVKDLLELARLGYSADDIKELLAMKTEDPEDADDDDLNPGDDDKGDDQPGTSDPIEAIIERNKKEKEGN